MSTYYVPGTTPSTFHALINLILIIRLWDKQQTRMDIHIATRMELRNSPKIKNGKKWKVVYKNMCTQNIRHFSKRQKMHIKHTYNGCLSRKGGKIEIGYADKREWINK